MLNGEDYSYFSITIIIHILNYVLSACIFLEQAVFIITSYFYEKYSFLLTGLFALIVITTVSAQKVMMESKSTRLEEYSRKSLEISKNLKKEYVKKIDTLRNNLKEYDEYAMNLMQDNQDLQKELKRISKK